MTRISVRDLVEFVLRSGSIDNRFRSGIDAQDGISTHKRVQSQRGSDYLSEVSLSREYDIDGLLLLVEGRADGVYIDDELYYIEEIKTTAIELDKLRGENELHWAQAMLYAHMLVIDKDLEKVGVALTYAGVDSFLTKTFKRDYTRNEISSFAEDLVGKYKKWIELELNHKALRNKSVEALRFPYTSTRFGQQELSKAVYESIKEEKNIYVNAPTGIGKTIATLYPSVKSFGTKCDKIFYLTAKTVTRSVALKACTDMSDKGLVAKTLIITAKDKICPLEKPNCNPEHCLYARGHFDRINDVLYTVVSKEQIITREVIESYSKNAMVCPAELALDVALFSDIIICDYNYLFDPSVYFRRFFSEGRGDYIFLVDEAHNLLERSKEMYSAELQKDEILNVRRGLKEHKKLYKALGNINSYFLKIKGSGESIEPYEENDEEILDLLHKFMSSAELYLTNSREHSSYEEVLELFFKAVRYIKISELFSDDYCFLKSVGDSISIKQLCLDPSRNIRNMLKIGRCSVMFSATLNPLPFYKRVLGGVSEDYDISLGSPFPTENRLFMINDRLSLKYKDRDSTIIEVAKYISEFPVHRKGNYLAFVPSFEYLDKLLPLLTYDGTIITQEREMSEQVRDSFLGAFYEERDHSLLGIAVIGGVFSEGVDLVGEALSGAIVVGTGIPKVSLERNLEMDYYQRVEGDGFSYAYTYPGFNKVAQALGRVIRTEEDLGIVLLIDNRYSTQGYQRLFPKDWFPYLRVNDIVQCAQSIKKFWRKVDGIS